MFMSYSEKVKRVDIKTQVTTEIMHECEICTVEGETAWFNETDLAVHRKDLHYDVIMQQMSKHADRFCTICMNLFDNFEELQQHIRYQHLLGSPTARRIERDIFICDVCDRIFFSKNVLELHMMHFHLLSVQERKWRTFVCPKCNKTCKIQTMWHHFQHHNIPSLTVCDICLHTFKSTDDLMSHTKDHAIQYKCDICDFHTTKDIIFDSHVDSHRRRLTGKVMGKKVRAMLWADLKRKEKSAQKYNIHHVLKGLRLPPFMHLCVMCKEICDSKNEVIEHILRDHTTMVQPEERPTYTCTCGANYHSRVLLKQHVFKSKGNHAEATDQNKAEVPEATDSEMSMLVNNDNIEVIPIFCQQVPIEYTPDSNAGQVTEMPAKSKGQVIEMPAESSKLKIVPAKSKDQVIEMPAESSKLKIVPAKSKDQVLDMKDGQMAAIQLEAEYDVLVDADDDDKQIVYVYAESNLGDDEQLVTMDQNSEQEIISF